MKAFFANAIDRAWVVLLLATAATTFLRADHFVGRFAGAATLAIAIIKGRIVVLEFMELRNAPTPWRLAFEGWIIVMLIALTTIYAGSA